MNDCSILIDPLVTVATAPPSPAEICESIDSKFSLPESAWPNPAVTSETSVPRPDSDAGFAPTGAHVPVSDWSDARLVESIRVEPPHHQALDELAQRYWKPLFSRCHLLTLNHAEASDLAQEAWCRILRSRKSLKPEGNFPGYLSTVAMNIWRDRCRSHRRAGAMAAPRLVSLDAALADGEGHAITLADGVPDLAALESGQQATLMMDVDAALAQLTPLIRGVLIARYLSGETCAEIGRRHGRSEQTVSGWVRQGIQALKLHLLQARAHPRTQAL